MQVLRVGTVLFRAACREFPKGEVLADRHPFDPGTKVRTPPDNADRFWRASALWHGPDARSRKVDWGRTRGSTGLIESRPHQRCPPPPPGRVDAGGATACDDQVSIPNDTPPLIRRADQRQQFGVSPVHRSAVALQQPSGAQDESVRANRGYAFRRLSLPQDELDQVSIRHGVDDALIAAGNTDQSQRWAVRKCGYRHLRGAQHVAGCCG